MNVRDNRDIGKLIDNEKLDRTLWVALKFGVPFCIILMLFIGKGLIANRFQGVMEFGSFHSTLMQEFILFSNHVLIVGIIALFEVVATALLKAQEQFTAAAKTNLMFNVFLILVTTLLLVFSELKMEEFDHGRGNTVLVLHYCGQLLLTVCIFLKILHRDLGFVTAEWDS